MILADLASYIPGFMAAYLILLVGSLSPGPSVALLIGVATCFGGDFGHCSREHDA